MTTLEEIWPPYGLRITSGPLDLRVVHEDDIPALVELALEGIHPPEQMPFYFPWTDAPKDELPRNMAIHYWDSRGRFKPDSWSLEFVVRYEGEVVGCQGIDTRHFAVTRTGETGSWLGLRHHGKGIGTLMRQTVCAFVFDHLGATQITSAAFVDNPASLAVSRKVGYQPNGQVRKTRREGECAVCQELVLWPDDLVRSPYPLEVTGLDPVKPMLGIG